MEIKRLQELLVIVGVFKLDKACLTVSIYAVNKLLQGIK